MKKSFLLFLAAFVHVSMMAQIVIWSIPPKYDKIEMALDDAILVTDSAGTTTVWGSDGKRFFSTQDHLNPFAEGKAVISDNAGNIKGYIDDKGMFHDLPDGKVAYDFPCFSDGLLCVKSGRGYGYFHHGGSQAEFLFFDRAYPFFGGYAVYSDLKAPEKSKDLYYNYHTTNHRTVNYVIGTKKFDPKDIRFLSSVAPDGRGIAVIKDKVYWFDAKTGDFTPMYGGGVEDKKNHVSVDVRTIDGINPQEGKKLSFFGRYGKSNKVEFLFDGMLRPDTVILDNHAITFPRAAKTTSELKSSISVIEEGGKKGLKYDGNNLVPPQFDDISLVYGNYAVVCQNGKWGLLEAVPDLTYSFIINDGRDIGFRHATFDTQIRLDLPVEISSDDVDFDVAPGHDCKLDKRFMEAKDTRAGNYLMYNCVLSIPENLPTTLTTVIYPIEVVYKGMKLYEYPLAVKAWHLKSYYVNIDDEETSVKNGRVTFTIDISTDRKPGDPDYPFAVNTKSDSLYVACEKISETRYKYLVDGFKEGMNRLDIIVTEKGCPSTVFPMELIYTKPSKKSPEQIEVRKKLAEAGRLTPTSVVE